MSEATPVRVGDRTLSVTNLDKVLYPQTGTTKAEVLHYYARVAAVMVRHTAGRCITMRRFPDGVEGTTFFEKRCPSHRPDWIPTAVGPGDRRGELRYCCFDEPAAIVWAANLAALELHAPMARAAALDRPRSCVFDLDPGPGTTIADCARLAVEIREVLDSVSLAGVAKTSGSKGMQVYVPLNDDGPDAADHEHCASFARAVGQLLERRHPSGVTTTMAKAERPGKVFVDWSQNAFHKTTICAYSMRGRPAPTVSTPLTWDEVERGASGADPLVFTIRDVLDRLDAHGDLFAAATSLEQRLPAPRS